MLTEEPIKSDHFLSLKGDGEGWYKEKGSKFLGFAYPVKSVEEAFEKVNELKTKYHDARHYCFAYRINPEDPQFRTNDDGEPSNSAGMPIYNQMLSAEIWNALIVVVRYFGGTKLGVSGLINAYKEAAAEAIKNAEIVEGFLMEKILIRFPYALMNDVMRLIKEWNLEMLEERMDVNAGYILGLRKSKMSMFLNKLEQYHHISVEKIM